MMATKQTPERGKMRAPKQKKQSARAAAIEAEAKLAEVRQVNMYEIKEPKSAMRTNPEDAEISSLAKSILELGQLQPIGLVKVKGGFEISFGHRRFLACKSLKRQKINAIILRSGTRSLLLARASENLVREDVTAWEEALAVMQLQQGAKMNQAQIAAALGKSAAWVSQRVAARTYPQKLRDALANQDITFSVARELARIKDPAYLQNYLSSAIQNGATPAVVRRWVDDLLLIPHSDDGAELPKQNNYNPEGALSPGKNCHFCGGFSEFPELLNIWAHKQCLHEIIADLVERAASQHEQQA